MEKFIGVVAVPGYTEVPVLNPGSFPGKLPEGPYVILYEGITESQLDAHREAVLVKKGGFLRLRVSKETRNNEARFTARELTPEEVASALADQIRKAKEASIPS